VLGRVPDQISGYSRGHQRPRYVVLADVRFLRLVNSVHLFCSMAFQRCVSIVHCTARTVAIKQPTYFVLASGRRDGTLLQADRKNTPTPWVGVLYTMFPHQEP